MPTPPEVLELIQRYDDNRDSYRSAHYNEAQVRQEFINPFFAALGWDVDNTQGFAEAYKDVVHEDSIKISGVSKAPDYSFRIGGTRKFFLEAKKPSVYLKLDKSAAFQLRRYAWSAKLALSVLTNFAEFSVYDCRLAPDKDDPAAKARLFYFTCKDYAEKWDQIADIFSKLAILKGSFDRFAESSKGKRGTEQVDALFLTDIENWRSLLARNLALRNPELSQRQLNVAVQRTIDRIVFLRICEDRGIEPYGQLQSLLNGKNVYPRLCRQLRDADDRYNSGLFHFAREKGREEEPDDLTLRLQIDDKTLQDILRGLYYPDSPYVFNVVPADILGQVYEQFLGKVIRLTDGHRAVIDDKPEVKKAGGVYYTPTYIVDYIVRQTVGKLLEGKTPQEAAALRILDPACGSGSFLIGAYQFLLDWHTKWYTDDGADKWSKGAKAALYAGPGGAWRLTTAERKRILLGNIYGVDIDAQAVEVTKLSLLLKVLEGENAETVASNLKLFKERALPDLGDNIKCGNSLISNDFFDNPARSDPDEETQFRINAFDWHDEFGGVMTKGGFDAVIGNPPYIGFHGFTEDKTYLKSVYLSARGKFDIYLPFVEKGIRLLNDQGILGYICPTNFMKRAHGEALRVHLRDTIKVIEVVDFEDVQVFSGALNYTGIFLFEKNKPSESHHFLYKLRSLDDAGFQVAQQGLPDAAWVLRADVDRVLIDKIDKQPVSRLGSITTGISEGVVTGQNAVFLLPQSTSVELGLKFVHPCIRGRQIRRYQLNDISEVVVYPYTLVEGKTRVVSEGELKKATATYTYLHSQREKLKGRGYFDASSKNWYELWCQRDIRQLASQKIVVAELSDANRFALAEADQFYGDTVCGITFRPNIRENIKYFLALLNSKLLEKYYKQTTVPKANGFYIYKTMFLQNIPIRRISFDAPADKARHDNMVSLVEKMLMLHKELPGKMGQEKTVMQRQIEATDRQIDALVYELYGLTEDEIKIVEGQG